MNAAYIINMYFLYEIKRNKDAYLTKMEAKLDFAAEVPLFTTTVSLTALPIERVDESFCRRICFR